MRSRSLIVVFALLISTTVLAKQPQFGDNTVHWTLQAGTVYQSSTSLDKGGDMSAGRYFASGGVGKFFANRWRMGVSVGYGEDHYDFSGSNGFAALDPWSRVRELRFSVPVQYFANKEWTVYAIPSVRFNAESGTSLSEGKNGGLIAGASYRISDELAIGPGFGVFSEIEDSTSFFPILIVDWKITDTLSLETGRGFAASRGPGLQLRWQMASNWEFIFGGRYEKIRFRLDDSGPAPNGIGQDKAFPLFALAEYAFGRDTRLSLVGGAEVGANMQLEDSNGRHISDSDLSTAPFLGAAFQMKF
jgi:outer membrane receptor protein involved in Fe transport